MSMVFINMAKIRITESQYKVITESENVISDYNEWADDAIKLINTQFGRLAFATLADILDGDIDLKFLGAKITQLDNTQYSRIERVTNFFDNHVSDDEYYEKWDKIHRGIEDKNDIITKKLEVLEKVVDTFIELVEMDAEEHFSDIETRKI